MISIINFCPAWMCIRNVTTFNFLGYQYNKSSNVEPPLYCKLALSMCMRACVCTHLCLGKWKHIWCSQKHETWHHGCYLAMTPLLDFFLKKIRDNFYHFKNILKIALFLTSYSGLLLAHAMSFVRVREKSPLWMDQVEKEPSSLSWVGGWISPLDTPEKQVVALIVKLIFPALQNRHNHIKIACEVSLLILHSVFFIKTF